jgi:hypothetical protein
MLASRLKPFTDAENEAIVATLAKRINSHRHSISRSEAIKQVGLSNVQRSEDADGGSFMWDLYLAFEGKLQINDPLIAEDEFWRDDNLEVKEHPGVKCCYVETELASRVCKYDMKITRLREPFQSLTVSPQISLNAPAIPAGIDQAQVIQILQLWLQNAAPQAVQQAVDNAVQQVKKAAPTKGFQRVEFMRRWESEPVQPPP